MKPKNMSIVMQQTCSMRTELQNVLIDVIMLLMYKLSLYRPFQSVLNRPNTVPFKFQREQIFYGKKYLEEIKCFYFKRIYKDQIL